MGMSYFPPMYDLSKTPEENIKILREYTRKHDREQLLMMVIVYGVAILGGLSILIMFLLK